MAAYKVLGDRIKKIRLENNMTQQEFAEALGYTHKSMINKIELGKSEMSYEKIIKLNINTQYTICNKVTATSTILYL